MTNSSPPERPEPRTKPLKKDEKIALFVAFATLGSIFFWGFNRAKPEFDLAKGDSLKTLAQSPTEWKFPPVLQPTTEEDGIALLDPDRDRQDAEAILEDEDLEGTEVVPEADADEDSFFGTLEPIVPVLPAVGLLVGEDEVEDEVVTATDDVTPIETEEAAIVPEGEAQAPVTPESPEEATIATPPSPELPEEETQINPNLPEPEEPVEFADVPAGYWAFPFISGLSSRKAISGFDGNPRTFEPDSPVNRAQLAVQIEKIFDLRDKQPRIDFEDVTQNFWAAAAIGESSEANFLNGYPDGEFRPTQTVPRLELLIALATGLGLQLPEDPEVVLQQYQDGGDVPDWAKPKIAAATQAGLVAGYPDRNQLELDRPATRAEVVAMMYQALVLRGKADPIESEYLVPANP
ncbi:S-layer homology domain-containing protein [Oscillatoriales cyanobacterium LEGE 11467]|uniref:S-layer homology domain-containing protein n=1 Tax=Zarconia navalis LEGE 11467 TaxID=1828826 RepID=A0A928Z7N5_9CYAN|nr:S-layer homology domain-containing protein [Zarconia navalis]MBE9039639.1 S-layer homology domain-containing protein [Zarconia navalis LEGE 11467]